MIILLTEICYSTFSKKTTLLIYGGADIKINTSILGKGKVERTGSVKARFFLISNSLEQLVCDTDIKPGFSSDHSLVTLSLKILNTVKRGRGTWKFNNPLFKDEVYVKI